MGKAKGDIKRELGYMRKGIKKTKKQQIHQGSHHPVSPLTNSWEFIVGSNPRRA